MSDKSAIEWTDATWNPVRGCSRVSEGCRNCYAERVAARFSGPGMAYEGLAIMRNGEPRWTGKVAVVEKHMNDPLRWKTPRRVFVNSMSDLFHESLSDHDILRVFKIMNEARRHTFQILTKRPHAMFKFVTSVLAPWPPLPNVWLGVSAEDQDTADFRIPALLATPAAVRFVSAEPLLGPISFRAEWWPRASPARLDWMIVGGESGPNARPMHPQWVRSLRDQSAGAGVAFFFKQWGEHVHVDALTDMQASNIDRAVNLAGNSREYFRIGKKAAGRVLDERTWDEFPVVAS